MERRGNIAAVGATAPLTDIIRPSPILTNQRAPVILHLLMEEMEVTERGDMTEAWEGMGQTQLPGQREGMEEMEEMEEKQAAGNLRFLHSFT